MTVIGAVAVGTKSLNPITVSLAPIPLNAENANVALSTATIDPGGGPRGAGVTISILLCLACGGPEALGLLCPLPPPCIFGERVDCLLLLLLPG